MYIDVHCQPQNISIKIHGSEQIRSQICSILQQHSFKPIPFNQRCMWLGSLMERIKSGTVQMAPYNMIDPDDINPQSPDIFQMLIDCRLQRELKQAEQSSHAKLGKMGKKKIIKKRSVLNKHNLRHRRHVNYNDENTTKCEQSKGQEQILDIYQEKNRGQQYDSLFQQDNEQVRLMVQRQVGPGCQPLEFYYCGEGLPSRKISPSLRRQLIIYLYNLCYEYRTSRAVFCLGSHIFDEYVCKTNKKMTSNDYHVITKACLTLSMKFQGSQHQANVLFTEKISKKVVNQAEKEILCLLAFQLHTQNYNIVADCLIEYWDKFAKICKKREPILSFYQQAEAPQQALINITSFYDKLDCINTISYSHEFSLKDLCFNLFFLLIYMKAEKIHARPGWKANIPDMIFQAYGDQKYSRLFARFLLFAKKQPLGDVGQLNIRVGFYLAPFLQVPTSESIWYQKEAPKGWNLTQLRRNEHLDQFGFDILKKMTEKNSIMI